jgi:hypothetical protein
MSKSFLLKSTFLLIFITSNAFAQSTLKSSGAFLFSGYYGMSNKLGIDFIVGGNTIWGFGVSTHLGKAGIGENYSKTMGPSKFPNDIYEITTADVVGVYGMIGFPVTKKLTVLGKLGAGTSSKFYNAFDKYKILSSNGYYYNATDAGTSVLIGASCIYITGNLSPFLSYDTFSGLGFGAVYSFKNLK